jgi:hypothetical protein
LFGGNLKTNLYYQISAMVQAWKLHDSRRFMDLVDHTLSIQLDEEELVHRVINTALACIQTAPERRPTMAQVVGMLQGDIEIGQSIKGRLSENLNQIHRNVLGITSTITTCTPKDAESQALYVGESSSSTQGVQVLELTSVKAR